MKKLLSSGISFVKENPKIIYSLILIVFVPAAFFANTYYITSKIEKDIDLITQRKAVMAEKIIDVIIKEKINDEVQLQKTIDEIAQKNEMLSVAILKPEANTGKFRVVASQEKQDVGAETDSTRFILAWKYSDGISFLDSTGNNRSWNVTKSLKDAGGNKTALISMTFSLKESDALINKTITNSYIILIVTILVVILLVSNQARLFGYVLTLSKLKEIDQMKDTFISMASHELRSPLTAIKGYTDILMDKKDKLDDESQRQLKNIAISADRLNALVNDILEVSRIEGNRIPINLVDFNPAEIISQSTEELRSQAIQKGLELTYEVGSSAIVKADADRIKQVLVNLIGNAIKYTQSGSVKITTKIKDKQYLIVVADTGFGISSEDQKKLFQKFSRIQNDKTNGIVGTGLGLWITQELASKMNGNITVESIEGTGSHFTLHLPIAKK